MDTFVNIKIVDPMEKGMKTRIARRVVEQMKKLEKKFSFFSENGELAMINRLQKNDKLKLSPEMFRALNSAKDMHIETKGAFDVTMGLDSWRLDRAAKTVWFTNDEVKIDLGGIAKGVIVDEAIALMKKLGVTNAMINAGGDMYCLGSGPNGKGWKVGVRSPRDPKEIIEVLKVFDKGVATSGGYERFTRINGKIVSHITDPKTRKPVKDIFKSVTIVANDATTADALATAFYTMDPREAILIIQEIGGADCLIIDRNGMMYASGGIPEQR